MHRYENFATKKWRKNVGKGYLFQRVILAGTYEWRGTLALCDSVVPPPPIGSCCRGTQIIWFHQIYGMHRFCNQTMKKVLERTVLKLPFQDGAPIQRAILGGALEWKGTLRVPPQPGCPRVCPPWAHRSYATDLTKRSPNPLGCLKNHWTNTRPVCTYLNAFFMLNPNRIMKIWILIFLYFFIFLNFENFGLSSAPNIHVERVNGELG